MVSNKEDAMLRALSIRPFSLAFGDAADFFAGLAPTTRWTSTRPRRAPWAQTTRARVRRDLRLAHDL
jgi:hypothetical protein